MAKYMDLVLVEDLDMNRRRIVCKAPWMSHLEKGTQVYFELSKGTKFLGEVVATMDLSVDEREEIDFILAICGQSDFHKILSKVKVIGLNYEDEDDA